MKDKTKTVTVTNPDKNSTDHIADYFGALEILDSFDKGMLETQNGNIDNREITYEDCKKVIDNLPFRENSTLFGVEREHGLQSIIRNIYQSFGGEYLYKTVEEKSANLLYYIIKNHVFIDGNKRIAAALFIYFLDFYGILYNNRKTNN